jgi:amino acid transporter
MAPQIIYLSLVFIGLLIAANQHGKERTPHNFWITLVGTTIAFFILYWGGFFDIMFKG